MPKCIFCLTTDSAKFNTKEHILPESLGGGDWAILPDGLYCDACQNKFGSSIEQQALADYPFINLRTLLAIPTKKKKAPWFNYWEGMLQSAGYPGRILYQPNVHFEKAFGSGQKTLTIIPAMTKKPDMVLRTLIKIGLEVLATDGGAEEIFRELYNPAREYALAGIKKYPWFYLMKEDIEALQLYIKGEDWEDHHVFMDVHHEDNGLVYLHFKLFYLQFMVPLVENVVLDSEYNLLEPEARIFTV